MFDRSPTSDIPRHHDRAALAALLADLDVAVGGRTAVPTSDVAGALRPHLGRRDLLAADHRRAAVDRYRTNVVHVDPAGRWSLVALVWRPGQRTPIHSHASWCVVGVHEGRELERTFRLVDGRAREVERRVIGAGDVVACDAGDDDIHEVA